MSEVKFDEAAFKKWYESSPGAFGYTPVACARWQFEQLKPKIDAIIYENLRCKEDFFVLNEEVKQRNIDIKNKDNKIQQLQSELKKKDELLDECERLFERLIESFNYALENNLKLTPSKQFHFLFLLDDEGRMIFKFTKEKELLQKLKERGK